MRSLFCLADALQQRHSNQDTSATSLLQLPALNFPNRGPRRTSNTTPISKFSLPENGCLRATRVLCQRSCNFDVLLLRTFWGLGFSLQFLAALLAKDAIPNIYIYYKLTYNTTRKTCITTRFLLKHTFVPELAFFLINRP